MWRAPPAGSGCVIFTAMVLESPSRWFAEDGQLSRTFCEMSAKETEELDELRCCSCDEAKYKVYTRYGGYYLLFDSRLVSGDLICMPME